MQGTMTVKLYEYTGEPVKQCMDAWLNGIRDPMTDPKWRRKQRLKRIWRKIVSIFKPVAVITLMWAILRLVTKVVRNK